MACGADVTATDHYAPALDFAAHNAEANTGRKITTRLLDWHHPEADGAGSYDLILAADVLYERRNVEPLVRLIPNLLSDGGEFLLADPRRAGGEIFVERMKTLGFTVSTTEQRVVQDGRGITIAVHSFRR